MTTLDDIIEKLHTTAALGGIINDGKTHKLHPHGKGDACVTEAKAALQAHIDDKVREGIREHIQPHLDYCQMQNGLEYCKNCGLEPLTGEKE